ncbi:putative Capsular polysaccharide synthesis protein [Monocercomonoides exilis]|uniref:putative Capsular polysaccharide synthesis protein n=1 Tax=Monocercomonoides exilis TaxID=2049356 RepID=UPI003559A8EE|nr:putative Capsular polysaccharide synthesis protein [Monocercomonoides exilis]|eukprot:MONOS_11827.1-p1 / transcript=MONOS_11827.1 / gene=MONOS_11827 / organism=Monocercomonoides_exilis_PA203 / gene_product=unspecified product / transcript_product=unspecified product / location=Mono_scaffold00616:12149-13036(+) / protein_length=295 / sequence_SO=supercontig / SO=protein_coding / is_pseudo=false
MYLLLLFPIFLSAAASSSEEPFLQNFVPIQDEDSYEVPKIIWLYWEGKMNQEVRYLLHNLKEKVKNFTPIFITDSTLSLYMDRSTIPSKMKKFPRAIKADFYRLQLLYKYGGLWMDATTYICNETFLEECHQKLTKAKADLLAFNSYYPPTFHIEFGFLMAPKGSPLLGKVLEEFRIMMPMGRLSYMKDRIYGGVEIKSPVIHKFGSDPEHDYWATYYVAYVCMQTVVQREFNGNPNVILMDSEDYFYKLNIGCDWESACIADRWENDPEVRQYPITKFCSGSRGIVKFPDVDII